MTDKGIPDFLCLSVELIIIVLMRWLRLRVYGGSRQAGGRCCFSFAHILYKTQNATTTVGMKEWCTSDLLARICHLALMWPNVCSTLTRIALSWTLKASSSCERFELENPFMSHGSMGMLGLQLRVEAPGSPLHLRWLTGVCQEICWKLSQRQIYLSHTQVQPKCWVLAPLMCYKSNKLQIQMSVSQINQQE